MRVRPQIDFVENYAQPTDRSHSYSSSCKILQGSCRRLRKLLRRPASWLLTPVMGLKSSREPRSNFRLKLLLP